MNMKKILSSLLVVVLLFGAFACVIPTKVEAAHISTGSASTLTKEEIKKVVQNTYSYGKPGTEFDFENYTDMLNYEFSKGYLDSVSSKDSKYTIYVNRYTGTVYYVNNLTSEVIASNPYNPYELNPDSQEIKTMMSQVYINFNSRDPAKSDKEGKIDYLSTTWAAEYGQISVSPINGGLRVNYTLGDTTTRFMVPGAMTADSFMEYIIHPMLDLFVEILTEAVGEDADGVNFDIYSKDQWGKRVTIDKTTGYLSRNAVDAYVSEMRTTYRPYLTGTDANAQLYYIGEAIKYTLSKYAILNPELATDTSSMNEKYPITTEGIAVAVRSDMKASEQRTLQSYFLKYTSYNYELLDEHEKECGYNEVIEEKPVFRCALEYTFGEDGSLVVRVPANAITYDEVSFLVNSITTLRYFGAGDLKNDGYVFVPDGSGSIVEHGDFYNAERENNVAISLSVYANDFTYGNPDSIGAHYEAVTMPVYGIVSTEKANATVAALTGKDKITTGFFAILEDGASLSKICASFETSKKLSSAYSQYAPYPSDKFYTNGSAALGGASYTMVSSSKYTGAYVTRYVMLTDPALQAIDLTSYPTTYVGMATYYRDYLKANGTLTALTNLSEDLPLYIEALGSMNVVEKILTFPVTVSKPLTTFEDVITMYDELAGAKEKLRLKAKKCREDAEAETKNAVLRKKYLDKAVEYDRLAKEMENITNISFKLTGFANGGMYFTYPSKVKWESACGGNAGFNKLLTATEEKSVNGSTFAIYPEFDFLYMSNKAWFDGVDETRDLARMIDNRYASKQEYNSILGAYESLYAMVISADALDNLYDSFRRSYSAYNIKNISVSTLAQDLNSNFNVDNYISRADSEEYVVSLLDRIANKDKYNVMSAQGNSYALPYVNHILDIAIDSSHLAESSYTIPFTGMVLHSYVNYSGSALNYSGSPEYNILRSIENGASLYYILCYQDNANFMKEDDKLNDYYGVDYDNWYDDVVKYYNELNHAIGDLQGYEIVDHKTLIAERAIEESEYLANETKLKAEFVAKLRAQITEKINAKFDEIYNLPSPPYGAGIEVTLDADAILDDAAEILKIDKADLVASGFDAEIAAIKAEYESEYPSSTHGYAVHVDAVAAYVSEYSYITDSDADAEDYIETDYTLDNDRVVIVTYSNGTDTVRFLLNYNVYKVTVRLSGVEYSVDNYGFIRIEG